MNPNIRQILKLTISLVLYGLLSGCFVLANMAADASYAIYTATQKDYEPIIMTSSENKIKIKYRSVGSKAEHEQVKQLMSDHCHGAYIETSRVELRGYDTVEAECTHGTESLPSLPIPEAHLSIHDRPIAKVLSMKCNFQRWYQVLTKSAWVRKPMTSFIIEKIISPS